MAIALLLLFAPEANTAEACASVRYCHPERWVPHCATTERTNGAPASSIDASTVADIVCARLIRKHDVLGLTITPLANV